MSDTLIARERPSTVRVPSPTPTEMPRVPLTAFIERFRQVLPVLINCISAPEIRAHEVWGKAIPYDVPHYGTGPSPGHCVRPDIVYAPKTDRQDGGPKICELDFIPSGRGFALSALADEGERLAFTGTFRQWYRKMGVSRVRYATATNTTCDRETAYFCDYMRRQFNFDIKAVNIDTASDAELEGALIDRLSYRSEMSTQDENRRSLKGLSVATAEPYLDSKAIFALVHDPAMSNTLKQLMGAENLIFLRDVFPNSVLLKTLQVKPKELEKAADLRHSWVLKATAVETDGCWGCRSTIIGADYGKTKFLEALQGKMPNGKHNGGEPILQRYFSSRDFWESWNDTVDGRYALAAPLHSRAGEEENPILKQYARREVKGRVGIYFLVVRETGETLVPPYGLLTLRQDRLVHGAKDAMCLAVETR